MYPSDMDLPRNAPRPPSRWSRRKLLRSGAAVAFGTAAGAGMYASLVEPRWVEFVERTLPVENLPASWQGARLVQLSDLHVGPQVGSDYLIDVFRRVGRLEPEVIAVTGDFVTYSHPAVVDELARVLEHLPRGSRATVGILGNHDYGRGWREPDVASRIQMRARDAGVDVLRNAVHYVDGFGIVGMDELWSRNFKPREALRATPERAALVALSHNPDSVDRRGWEGFRGWVLSGHTHGGQCKPPFLPPPIVPVRNKRYTAGAFDLGDGRHLYINRGLGHALKVRFNARPEVTVFTLRRAATLS